LIKACIPDHQRAQIEQDVLLSFPHASYHALKRNVNGGDGMTFSMAHRILEGQGNRDVHMAYFSSVVSCQEVVLVVVA